MDALGKLSSASVVFVMFLAAPEPTLAAPTAVTKGQDLQFGLIACDQGTSGSVSIDTNGGRVFSGGVRSFGTAYAPAQFVITGDAGATYTLALPTQFSATSGGSTMTVTSITASIGNTGVIPASGSLPFAVGGTLLVNSAQQSGVYNGALSIAVK